MHTADPPFQCREASSQLLHQPDTSRGDLAIEVAHLHGIGNREWRERERLLAAPAPVDEPLREVAAEAGDLGNLGGVYLGGCIYAPGSQDGAARRTDVV